VTFQNGIVKYDLNTQPSPNLLNESLLFYIFNDEWNASLGIGLINNTANDTSAVRLSTHPGHCYN
jgi:hypothetical protein